MCALCTEAQHIGRHTIRHRFFGSVQRRTELGNSENQPWWASLPDEELIEHAWERQMTLSGIYAFERSKYTKDGKLRPAAEMPAGQKMIRQSLDAATTAIEKLQRDIVDRHRVERSLKATLMVVPADTLALLTLKVLFDVTLSCDDTSKGYSLQHASVKLARLVEQELNFLNWLQKSREAARAYAQEKGWQGIPKSMAEKLVEEQGVTSRSMRRWKQTFAELNEYEWQADEYHFCGEALIGAVIDSISDVFNIHRPVIGGVLKKHVRLHADKLTEFVNIETKLASMQIGRKPMLSKPRRWTAHD